MPDLRIRGHSRARERARWLFVVLIAALISNAPARADVYQTPDDFIRSAFGEQLPSPFVLWPDAALQQRMRAVLGHPYRQLRLRYWRDGRRTAWVLAEVGKEEEITIGFVLSGDAIERTDVLEFREQRGWEIRFPAFTHQFQGIGLEDGDRLDRRIDGITGATLSVTAYEKLARLALVLHMAVLDTDAQRATTPKQDTHEDAR